MANKENINSENDALTLQTQLLHSNWAYFHLVIEDPLFDRIEPPQIIKPKLIAGTGEYEFVYDIVDYGQGFLTCKAEEMLTAGQSMCKLFYTIEKIIYLFIERLKSSGTDSEGEVQVSIYGFLSALRKAFEVIINLNYNVIVTNFDPGAWGEFFLAVVKRLADKGYGFIPGAPRTPYITHSKVISPHAKV